MGQDEFLKNQMKTLKDQTQNLGSTVGGVLDAVFGKFKEMLSDEDYQKWKDLNGRLLTARLNNDQKKIKSIENDLKELFEKQPE